MIQVGCCRSECYSGRMLLRAGTVAVVFLLALSLHAQQQMAKPQSALVIQGLGKGQVKLNGFWQFHTGDDPRWASPSLDDSAWEPITASGTWGSQDHPDIQDLPGTERHHVRVILFSRLWVR
jgi:nicotinamidase-related amidase